MSTISAATVKALRDRTNLPMMDCKAALVETDGDMEKAVDKLRAKFAGMQAKRADRETAEGRIATYIDGAKKVASIVEVRCESAPSAKNEHFVTLANDVAKHLALNSNATTVEALLAEPFAGKKTVAERFADVVGVIRENMKPARFVRVEGGLAGSYIHHDGSTGVLMQVEGDKADDALLRDVCMHVVARNPAYARREDVPAAVLDKEKEIAKSQIEADPKNKNKPANIMEMIVQGKLKTWYADNVLVEQPFVKDDSKTVGDVLQGAGYKLLKFVRYKVGELS